MKIILVAASLLWMLSISPAHAISESSLRSILSRLGSAVEVTSDGAVLDGAVYFVADDGLRGSELWRTDGTVQGTWQVKDIFQGEGSASPGQPLLFSNRLYFPASDGINGRELWTSDGTESGTYMLHDINPGAGGSLPGEIMPLNGRLYFHAYEPDSGWELWTTNGTSLTYRVKDIAAGRQSGFPAYLTEFNGRLYFQANDVVHGAELWVSDGTEAGTYLVKDTIPGTVSGAPFYLNVVDERLYFRAFGTSITGIWVSDGTEANTQPVSGEEPGHVSLSWIPPTSNVDGTPLTDLAGYKIMFGVTPVFLDRVVEIYDPLATEYSIPFLRPGLYFFALRAVNAQGIESSDSQFVIKRIY